MLCRVVYFFFFFKQKTAYEMRISDWSSDVCSADLEGHPPPPLGSRLRGALAGPRPLRFFAARAGRGNRAEPRGRRGPAEAALAEDRAALSEGRLLPHRPARTSRRRRTARHLVDRRLLRPPERALLPRSEEHTSELQSLMRISYAVFCLKKKK